MDGSPHDDTDAAQGSQGQRSTESVETSAGAPADPDPVQLLSRLAQQGFKMPTVDNPIRVPSLDTDDQYQEAGPSSFSQPPSLTPAAASKYRKDWEQQRQRQQQAVQSAQPSLYTELPQRSDRADASDRLHFDTRRHQMQSDHASEGDSWNCTTRQPKTDRRRGSPSTNDESRHSRRSPGHPSIRQPSPSTSSLQTVTISNLAPSIQPSTLHAMLDAFCSSPENAAELDKPIDVTIHRNGNSSQRTGTGTGSAIVTFQKIAYARRFVDACGEAACLTADQAKGIASSLTEDIEIDQTGWPVEHGSITPDQSDNDSQRSSSRLEKQGARPPARPSNKGSTSDEGTTKKKSDSGKKSAPSSKKQQSSSTTTSHLATDKKAAGDIARWMKKQQELHGSSDDSEQDRVSQPPGVSSSTLFIDTIAMCCYLCSKKFKSEEILHRHEAESDLHKANLLDEEKRRSGQEKKRVADEKRREAEHQAPREAVTAAVSLNDSSTATTTTTAKYRDRALERRAIFGSSKGPDTTNHPHKKAKFRAFEGPSPSTPASASTDTSLPASTTPTSAPAQTPTPEMDSTNIGNILLRSMGWTEGAGIGADGAGIDKPIEPVRYAAGAGIGSVGAGSTSAVSEQRQYGSMTERAREERKKRYHQDMAGE